MLSINIYETILTVGNFLLLYVLLKHFLFDPVLRFMDERKKRIDEGLALEKQANDAIARAEEQAAGQLAGAESEAKRILDAADTEDQNYEMQLMQQAEERAAQLKQSNIENTEKRIGAEEQTILSFVPDYAASLAEKLLNE